MSSTVAPKTCSESGIIVFYDIPSKFEPRCWSLNMWKVRLVLNMKGAPYRTEWISYPDIEPTFKKLGIPPSMKKSYNGQDHYTCPSIIDYTVTPEKPMTDSKAIAQYLDEKYSLEEQYGPKLFPEGTKEAQLAFIRDWDAANGTFDRFKFLCLGCVPELIEDPRGTRYYYESREKAYGMSMLDFYPAGSQERKEAWEALQTALDALAVRYDENAEGNGEYAFGGHITYVDIVVVATFLWTRFTPVDRDGPETKCVWDIVKTWNGGRWQRLMDMFEKYLQPDKTTPSSMSSTPNESGIVLYDIPSKFEPRCWSINMWKVRLVLNMKGAPYRTEWISYPDIESTFKKIGIPPSTKKSYSGQDHYTCPSIIDYTVTPEKPMTESKVIAQYLDEKYASEEQHGPKLFPEGTKEAQLAFIKDWEASGGIGDRLDCLCLPCVPALLEDPRGTQYYYETREKMFGKPLLDLGRAGSQERKEAWEAFRKDLDVLAVTYDKNEEGNGECAFGNHITYVDIVVVSALLWTRFTPVDRDGPESKCVWDTVKTWNGGRWQRLMDRFERYLQVK
ncbi:hypothetical protein FRB97_002318 [Tulasnella sp. 331]|nr:hypothetical protein FRB97_002318 [Tulasnella sp. 331]